MPPTAPSQLSSPAQTPTSIEVQWDSAVDNVAVASYRVFRDGSWVESTSSRSHISTNLTPLTQYRFQVSAVDTSGNESPRTPDLDVLTPPAFALQSIEVKVEAGADDAEERTNNGNAVVLGSTDLEVTRDRTREQRVGMLFRAVEIPRGATIENAHLQFTVDESTNEATALEIRGEASDDAPSFESIAESISARPLTSQVVTWSPAEWIAAGSSGTAQRSPNLAPVVQEIVDRTGWRSGNALVLIVTGTGSRVAESYDGSPNGAPIVEIDYRVAPVPPDTSPPSPPTGLSSPSQTAFSVSLEWDASSDDVGVTYYRVILDGAEGSRKCQRGRCRRVPDLEWRHGAHQHRPGDYARPYVRAGRGHALSQHSDLSRREY